ncbi:PAS domain S-box protein [Novosphingobium sp. TCA1]|uniref:histidine kinase n=1 Tax=Novosphingobium pentaromativorans TaxID=205844 RepID=A0A2W5NIZ7_9SPHN|nr:PAS domain S-box protein [Novosphingobium sp. TCA1]PZQ53436.1 MAG: PAS domain-containing sensor histidine kinase [Novosphingobium pentaromativorans]
MNTAGRSPRAPLFRSDRSIALAALASGLTVFALDIFSPLQGAVAVLYTSTVLIASWSNRQAATVLAGAGCSLMALAGFWYSHWDAPLGSPAMRLGVALFAIAMITMLSVRHRSARDTLAEQARMLELTHDTVVVRGPDDTILYWNEGAERLYGWTRAEALGRPAQHLLQTVSEGNPMAAVDLAGTWSGEISRVRKDGTRIVLESRWLARRDTLGRETGIFETSADITRQRAEAQARRQSEERYHTIFHAAGLPMLEIDLSGAKAAMAGAAPQDIEGGDGAVIDIELVNRAAAKSVILDANEAAVQLFGVNERADLIGGSLLRFHTPSAEQSLGRLLAALVAGRRDIEEEAQFLTESGALVDVVTRLTLLEDDDSWSRLLMLCIDVTERYRMQRRLAQAQNELTEVNRTTTLGQVAAFIAHELNQPLTAISAFASSGKRWLAREAPGAVEVADCLDKIALSGHRAADVIARVRRLFRKGETEQVDVDMQVLIRETAGLLDRELRESAVTLHLGAATDLPRVTGDRVLLQQVLVNLILNARKAMSIAADSPRDLWIEAARADGMIAVDVIDSGTGLLCDPRQIFEPFFSSREDGMGIGLSISRSIVEQHGGTIEAANRPEGGARFRFSIPVAVQTATA